MQETETRTKERKLIEFGECLSRMKLTSSNLRNETARTAETLQEILGLYGSAAKTTPAPPEMQDCPDGELAKNAILNRAFIMLNRKFTWTDTSTLLLKDAITELSQAWGFIQQLACCNSEHFTYLQQESPMESNAWRDLNNNQQPTSHTRYKHFHGTIKGVNYTKKMNHSQKATPGMNLATARKEVRHE